MGSGAGLGISICKQLVGLMKGELAVRSSLGRGTTVTVELPLAESSAPVCAHAMQTRTLTPTTPNPNP
jgi:signal transduction histidine kinase